MREKRLWSIADMKKLWLRFAESALDDLVG